MTEDERMCDENGERRKKNGMHGTEDKDDKVTDLWPVLKRMQLQESSQELKQHINMSTADRYQPLDPNCDALKLVIAEEEDLPSQRSQSQDKIGASFAVPTLKMKQCKQFEDKNSDGIQSTDTSVPSAAFTTRKQSKDFKASPIGTYKNKDGWQKDHLTEKKRLVSKMSRKAVSQTIGRRLSVASILSGDREASSSNLVVVSSNALKLLKRKSLEVAPVQIKEFAKDQKHQAIIEENIEEHIVELPEAIVASSLMEAYEIIVKTCKGYKKTLSRRSQLYHDSQEKMEEMRELITCFAGIPEKLLS